MGLCRRDGGDQLLKELVAKGINIVLPPREGLKVGDLILADPHGVARTADWRIVLGVEPPLAGRQEPSFESVSFKVSGALGLEAGASIAGRALAIFGLGEAQMRAGLKQDGATHLNLSLTAPAVASLTNLDEILEALRESRASPRQGYRDRRLLVVVKTWRARGLSLELKTASGGHVALSAKATDELRVQGNLEIKDRSDGRITFVAKKPLVFGVTLRELNIDLSGVSDAAPPQHFSFRSGSNADVFATLSDELFTELPLVQEGQAAAEPNSESDSKT